MARSDVLRRMIDTLRVLHFDEREALQWAMTRAIDEERSRRSDEDTKEVEIPRGE